MKNLTHKVIFSKKEKLKNNSLGNILKIRNRKDKKKIERTVETDIRSLDK